MKRCPHDRLRLVETIEAETQHWFHNVHTDKLFHNNEPGNYIRSQMECTDCGKRWSIYGKMPKKVKELYDRIDTELNK